MPNRTPSFIVVGLIMVMFLLGFFYMSCSSTTTELRQTLNEFEERIRTLTRKGSDYEKQIDLLNNTKHELQEEKIRLQKQIDTQGSELIQLNTGFKEAHLEAQRLLSEKESFENQLKACKNQREELASKITTLEKTQHDQDNQKKTHEKQFNDLKQQNENYQKQIKQFEEKILLAAKQIKNAEQNAIDNSNVHQRVQRSTNDTLGDNHNKNLTIALPLNEINHDNPNEPPEIEVKMPL